MGRLRQSHPRWKERERGKLQRRVTRLPTQLLMLPRRKRLRRRRRPGRRRRKRKRRRRIRRKRTSPSTFHFPCCKSTIHSEPQSLAVCAFFSQIKIKPINCTSPNFAV